MFYKLVMRNSRRNRKENGFYFASMLVTVIAFYIILALSNQDVMLFLREMESDAVNRLLGMIPLFYGMSLMILFFLVFFASRFQMEKRRHEFGIYMMMGMRRRRLAGMLLLEELRGSVSALLIGLPVAVFLSEMISLATARAVGLDIITHHFTLSWQAVFWTAAGFVGIRLATFLILGGKTGRREIGELLVEMPEGTYRRKPWWIYALSAAAGVICLGTAYFQGISGAAWQSFGRMGITLFLGCAGTFLLFYGMSSVIELIVRCGQRDYDLKIFNFRQLEETIIRRPSVLSVSSLLVTAGLCCFGAGTAIAGFYGDSEEHVLDYTFYNYEEDGSYQADEIGKILEKHGVSDSFSELFEVKAGMIRTAEDFDNAFQMDSIMSELEEFPDSEAKTVLLNNLGFETSPYLIQLSSYNRLLEAAGHDALELSPDEAAVYMDAETAVQERIDIMNQILKAQPEVFIDEDLFRLTGKIQTTAIVTDRSVTFSFALIVPDEVFDYYTMDQYDTYVNGILRAEETKDVGLMTAIYRMNEKLDETGLNYESYLQNMGRQLFYMVAASYTTIYLAIIFLIVANTVLGVQFLMNQQKIKRRYKTLIRLGAAHKVLARSAAKQINWFFGLPVLIGAVSSLFGVRALFSGMLSSRTQGNVQEMMIISAAMILVLCVVECIYMNAVKRSSSHYLSGLMAPEREE